jgi:hypothetical protein
MSVAEKYDIHVHGWYATWVRAKALEAKTAIWIVYVHVPVSGKKID